MGNDPRQQSDFKNRSVGLLALITGALVAALAWKWPTPSGRRHVEAAYLFVDVVSLRVQHPRGRQRVQMLVA